MNHIVLSQGVGDYFIRIGIKSYFENYTKMIEGNIDDILQQGFQFLK